MASRSSLGVELLVKKTSGRAAGELAGIKTSGMGSDLAVYSMDAYRQVRHAMTRSV